MFFKLFFHYSFPEEIFKIFSMEYSNFSFFFSAVGMHKHTKLNCLRLDSADKKHKFDSRLSFFN